jgi:hypothetical protein
MGSNNLRNICAYLISAIIWEIEPGKTFDLNYIFAQINKIEPDLKIDRLLPADYILVYRICRNLRKIGVIKKNDIGVGPKNSFTKQAKIQF